MINKIHKEAEIRMKKCIDVFKKNVNTIRTDRPSSHLLDNIKIEYYGVLTPLCKLANIFSDNSRNLMVNVFDHKLLQAVKTAILTSDLGLNPLSVGTVIRVPIPPLTEERRRNLIKIVSADAEQSKIYIRKIRRYANDKIKNLLKNKIINEDEDRYSQYEIQNMTDICINKINDVLLKKEMELIKI